MYRHLTALACAGILVASAQTVHAGINAWTSHGPDDGCVRALGIDPMAPNTLYAGGCHGLVSKSRDGGNTWSEVRKLPAPEWASSGTDVSVLALAIDPATPSTLYAGAAALNTGWGDLGMVFRSTDGGNTWSAVDANCPWGRASGGGDSISFPNPFPAAIAIDPTVPRTLYTSGCKSTDGGDTWQVQPFGVCSAVAIEPFMPDTLYGGCDGGVGYKAGVSKSTDGGLNWSDADTGLGANNSVLALALDPSMPTTLYAGTKGGVFKTTDGGDTWSAVNTGVGGQMVFALAIDPTTSSTLYAGTGSGVFKSTDGGRIWSELNTGLPANSSVTALAIDPTAPSTLYAGTDGGGVFSIEQVSTCGGDCNADGGATIDELVTLVNVALGTTSVVECGSGDTDGDGKISVDEIITAVDVVLDGCRPTAR
jgi:photosystem II stability/assembly factor-like uncharacterized protein